MEGVGKYCRGRHWNRDLTSREGSHSPMSLLRELQGGIWASRCLARFRSEGRWGGWSDVACILMIVVKGY